MNILNDNEVVQYTIYEKIVYPDGRVEWNSPRPVSYTPSRDSTEKWVGMFGGPGDEDFLRIYTLKDGREVEEYVQAKPWSSGPCIFLALRDTKTKEPLPETLWDEEDIENA